MKIELRMPAVNVNDDVVYMVRWLAPNLSKVEVGDPLCEVETSKANVEVPSPEAGTLQILIESGEIKIGQVFASVEVVSRNGAASDVKPTSYESNKPILAAPLAASVSTNGHAIPGIAPRFSKVALKMLQERQIPPSAFDGKSLVRKDDVLAYLGELPARQTSTPVPQRPIERAGNYSSVPELPMITAPGVLVPATRLKQQEIAVLSQGHGMALASTVFQQVNISGLLTYLRQRGAEHAITVCSLVLYETARLLRTYTELNAAFTEEGVFQYEKVNIGVAFDAAGHGLKAPAVFDADAKSVTEVADEVESLLESYLADKLPVEAFSNLTFTITDLSSDEVPWFLPLLPRRQSAILGIGMDRVALDADEPDTLGLILTFDHRVTEGRRAGAFLSDLKRRIQAYVAAAQAGAEPRVKAQPATQQCFRCSRKLTDIKINEHQFLIKVSHADDQEGYMCSLCLGGW